MSIKTSSKNRRASRILPPIIGLCLMIPAPLFTQISPGELSTYHSKLEGLSNCTKCHDVKGISSDAKCLSCHEEIRIQIDSEKGLHWLTVNEQKKDCSRCHSEHNGVDFELVFWESGMKAFDHRKSGFPLEGKHRSTGCRQCHQPKFILGDLLEKYPAINQERTFLGLGTGCVDCHGDPHRAQFITACTACHDLLSWRPASRFSHDKAKYPLNGKHREVSCGKCHPGGIDDSTGRSSEEYSPFVKYTGILYEKCESCHRYRHRTGLGPLCDRCHSTQGWKATQTGSFNHSKTTFPLKGLHRSTRCERCHKSGSLTEPLAFERCVECHEDIHRGEFNTELYGNNCEKCHTEEGFTPSTYEIAEHDESRYPLTGAHRAVPCISCHRKSDSAVRNIFKISFEDCRTCHDDEHRKQFETRVDSKGCRSCHNTGSWREVTFDHDSTSFRLDGKHRSVACRKCHYRVPDGSRDGHVLYVGLATSCSGCHGTDLTLTDPANQRGGEGK